MGKGKVFVSELVIRDRRVVVIGLYKNIVSFLTAVKELEKVLEEKPETFKEKIYHAKMLSNKLGELLRIIDTVKITKGGEIVHELIREAVERIRDIYGSNSSTATTNTGNTVALT